MVGTLPYPAGVPTTNRERLMDERDALVQRLARLNDDRLLGVLERSLERTALRERINEIDEEITEIDCTERYPT